MRRRRFLTGAAVTLAGLAAAGAGGGELFLLRRMKFEELGDAVVASVALPELLPTRDERAMQSIESGFATTLRFEATVVRTKSMVPVARRVRIVKIQWNPWRERYVVQTTDQGRGAAIRYYSKRDAAIAHAISLDRMRVARASSLERGPSSTYALTIVGQRNPIEPESRIAQDRREDARARGSDDLSAFSRWIGVFVQSAPRAEKTYAVRSSPAFYLVPR